MPIIKHMPGNCTPYVVKAMNELKLCEESTLVFEKNIYWFGKEGTLERRCNVSNNAHGIKNIIFIFEDLNKITIDGQGATFIFEAGTFPFVGNRAKNVTLKNFNIAYVRPFHTEGTVVMVNKENHWFDLLIDREKYPFRIEKGNFIAVCGNYECTADVDFLITEYDPETKAMAFGQSPYVLHSGKPVDGKECIWAEELDNGNVRFFTNTNLNPIPGNVLTFQNEGRKNCGIFFNRSENIRLENINIFECAGMGVVMQRTKNILLKNVAIRLREEIEEGYDPKRCVSITADATHFVNCMGTLELRDCRMMNMLDDATNIHGVYTLIKERISNDAVYVEYPHGNIQAYNSNESVYLVCINNMKRKYDSKIKSVEYVNERCDIITFDRELPEEIVDGFAVENVTAMPERVHISGCYTGHNRPRGFLITTCGKVLVENNTFCNPHCGIEMAADANFWFESGPVEDVEIRNNTFLPCGTVFHCDAITIVPSVPEGEEKFHGKISIHDNEFITAHGGLLTANRVNLLDFYNNIVKLETEEVVLDRRLPVTLNNCGVGKLSV